MERPSFKLHFGISTSVRERDHSTLEDAVVEEVDVVLDEDVAAQLQRELGQRQLEHLERPRLQIYISTHIYLEHISRESLE